MVSSQSSKRREQHTAVGVVPHLTDVLTAHLLFRPVCWPCPQWCSGQGMLTDARSRGAGCALRLNTRIKNRSRVQVPGAFKCKEGNGRLRLWLQIRPAATGGGFCELPMPMLTASTKSAFLGERREKSVALFSNTSWHLTHPRAWRVRSLARPIPAMQGSAST